MYFKKFREDSVQIPSQRNQIPSFRPEGPVMRPDTHNCLMFKLTSVWMFQQHVQTLFRVREESSVQVHPSERRGNTVQTPVNVRQVKEFPSQTRYVKIAATVQMSGLHRLDAILDKARRGEELQPFGRQSNTVQMPVLIMVIACSRSATVRMLGQHCADAALFRKDFQHFLESWLHSCSSRWPQLASARRLEKTESESI